MSFFSFVIPPEVKLIAGAAGAAMAVAGVVWVWHLQAEHVRHGQCLASAQAKPGSKPIGEVCEPPIAAAVQVATRATACDAQLATLDQAHAAGAPAVCSGAVQKVAAARDAFRRRGR